MWRGAVVGAVSLGALTLLASCTAGAGNHSTRTSGVAAAPILTAGPATSTPAGPVPSVASTAPGPSRPAPLSSAVAIQASPGWTYGKPTKLSVDEPAGDAQQVVTVSTSSTTATLATLRAWQRSGSSWVPYGPAVVAHVGRSGVTSREAESLTASPIGSYSLTEAFGRLPNPGTRLPYFQTSPSDWWISQPGQYYNTHQVCSANCPFNTGTPNARLYYVSPQYDLAVVIDYNRNPVVQGAGSGIFLHVTAGRPTNGCISLGLPDLVRVMRWLNPAAHPRILIGLQTA